MKKLFPILALAVLTSCIDKMNDLVHEEVPAYITAFEIDNQESSFVNMSENTVTVTLPPYTDPSKLRISKLEYTEGARISPSLAAGDSLDLAEPLTLTLTTYDPYKWTVIAKVLRDPEKPFEPENGPDPGVALTAEGPQIYNMGFDLWFDDADNTGLCYPYAENASEAEQSAWAMWPLFPALSGVNTVEPERSLLYKTGEGKAALKLESKESSQQFAAGMVHSGQAADLFPMYTAYTLGTAFTDRPLALEGYACYKPKTVDHAQRPYLDLMGKTDIGHVVVLLTDWNIPFSVEPPSRLVNYESDSGIIGCGRVLFEQENDGYVRFQVNIAYRNQRTPTYAVIIISSSAYGDFFTGAVGSVLYIDELAFLYNN